MIFKHKKIGSIVVPMLLIFYCCNTGFAQVTAAGNQALPLDPVVRTGKLPNGFTYYIRHNAEPKNRVTMYLANKVGSILEDADQRGLAHFMEHMSFNGTTHFPKNQLVDYLQKVGVRFGADLNAYTSFDETVYQLPLPSDDPEVLKSGFQIMRDWANGALLETSEINAERGVVLEEKRLHKGAGERLKQQYFPMITNYSRYAVRVPIGTDSVLNDFGRDQISRFYHDWYRPDLQALIVVGDIDVDAAEKTIKAMFGDLKNPDNERPRTLYEIELTGKNQFMALSDPELTSTSLQMVIKHPGLGKATAADQKNAVIRQLFNLMLAARLAEVARQTDAPFLKAEESIGGFMAGIDAYSMTVESKGAELEKGFKAAWGITQRIKQFGFTQTEFDRSKHLIESALDGALKNKDKTSSATYVQQYLDYFLKGTAAIDISDKRDMVVKDLQTILLADVNSLAGAYITDHDRDIIVTGPDKSVLPDEQTVNQWIADAEQTKTEAYVDQVVNKPLLASAPVAGKIVSEKKNTVLDITELTLSNGAKVYLKPTQFRNGAINIFAFAPGGSSLYPDAQYYSANNAVPIVSAGGVGNYSSTELVKFLSGKSIGTTPYISEYFEGVNGFVQTSSLENELQLLYAYFTEPRKDEKQFGNIITRAKANVANRNNNPTTMFTDTLTALLNNYAPRYAGDKLDAVNRIDLDDVYRIYRERFADASNFSFVLVGNFDIEKVKPLLEKYLAALPATHQHEKARKLDVHIAEGKIVKTLYKGLEPKANVDLIYSGSYNYSQKNNLQLDALSEILKIRLTERLRESESGVYTPGVAIEHRKNPTPGYKLTISFTCAPENVDKLIASANDEVTKLSTEGSSTVNLDKFKIETKKTRETYMQSNKFWLEYMASHLEDHEDMNDVNHYDHDLEQLNVQDLKRAANKYLNGKNYIRLVLLPESSKAIK